MEILNSIKIYGGISSWGISTQSRINDLICTVYEMTPLREVTFQHYTSSITQTYSQLQARPTFGTMYRYNIDNNTFNKENKIKSFTGLKNNIDVSTSIRFEHFPATWQEIFRPT